MRMLVSWDGSGHALGALRDVMPLFRERSVELAEIVLVTWPARDIARWSDIYERQIVSDDLHRAAAEVTGEEVQLLEEIIRPIARKVTSSTADGPYVAVMTAAIERTNADLVLIMLGTHDASGVIAQTMQAWAQNASIPTLVLRPPATHAS
jgi:transcriptional regulator of acetoin/glycerol metabolism